MLLRKSIQDGELSETQKISVLLLIYKRGDKSLLQNYRPISLANLDYKILPYNLTVRVNSILPNIIHGAQAGYIPKRYIGQYVRLTEDAIEFFKQKDTTSHFMFVDF